MTEESSATETQTEGAKPEEQNEQTTEGKLTSDKLGPEGEKALRAFKDRARKAEKTNAELQERLDKIEEANKSETDKALDKARKEAGQEAEAEFEKERRSDRLQVAVARHARDLADVDDVVLNLERGDTDSLFDKDGKVDADALKGALGTLLDEKRHLKAKGVGKPAGTADGGEGEGSEGASFNDILRQKAGYR